MINIADFFKSLRLSWIRRYAIGNEKPLEDHWCDLLDMILDVKPHERMSIINRGAEFLTSKVGKYYPCLTEFLKSLQFIQKKWITPPETGDNRWEFQPIFYNHNINFKKVSKGRKFIILEDFGFKPDSYLLSLKLTDICKKGEFETCKERLKKVYGPPFEEKVLSIKTLKMHIKTLLTNPNKFPSLPLQERPKEGYFFEELSDLFYVSKKGRKNYRNC